MRLAEVAPSIRQEIRYAGSDNFTGRPVPGYAAAECWLRKEAALALAAAQTDALKQGVSTRRLRLLSSAAGNQRLREMGEWRCR